MRALSILLLAAAAAAFEIPRPSPDLAISMTDGTQMRLSQHRGKVLVLAFFLTTCPHCQKAIGYLTEDQIQLGPRGLQVLASSIEDQPAAAVPGFVQRFHPTFPVGFNTNLEAVYNYLQHPSMLILKMPTLVFIDRQGVIRAEYKGDSDFLREDNMGANIRKQIEALLLEKLSPPKKR